jgi:hypothetical protein
MVMRMKLLNFAASAILLLASGRSPLSSLPVTTTVPPAPAESRTLPPSTWTPAADSTGAASPFQCSEVNSAFEGGYICSRTFIEENSKLGQDRNLATDDVTTLIPVADSNSQEISFVQCTPVNNGFDGGYVCHQTPTVEGSELEQDHKPVSSASISIPVDGSSNGGEVSVQCDQVSSGFAGGYVCGRTDRKFAKK